MNGAVRSLRYHPAPWAIQISEQFFEDCAPEFPVYQGKYREFSNFGAWRRHSARNYDVISNRCYEIPYPKEVSVR
jgi:hypothetical protein